MKEKKHSFCTAINCMDGRVQLPVIHYMAKKFKVAFVDTITEPGPNGILANQKDKTKIKSILERIDISVKKHKSTVIAIAAHNDCAGNPSPDKEQITQTKNACNFIKLKCPAIKVIGLFVNLPNGKVKEIV